MSAALEESGSTHGSTVSPKAMCHVVLRTAPENLKKMTDYWTEFLGGFAYAFPTVSFIRYDEEHHRIGILAVPGVVGPKAPDSAGLEHIAFGYSTPRDLAGAYKHRKSRGVEPTWCVNHGPATSMYYTDPDGNQIECQVDNFDTAEVAVKFMEGNDFQENPIGVDFDAETFVHRVDTGEDEMQIKKYIPSGPRRDADTQAAA